MRLLDPRTTSYLRGPVLTYGSRVEAWRDGKLLLQVPVKGGRYTQKQGVVEAADLIVSTPATDEIKPDGPLHPLSPYGQRLRLVTTLQGPDGIAVDVPIGWFRIDDTRTTTDDLLEVQASDLGAVITDARLVTPREVGDQAGGIPIDLAVFALMATLVPIHVAGLPERTIGSKVVLRDRYDALVELLEAWGATARWDISGAMLIRPSASTTGAAVMAFDDGASGTVVTVDREARPSRWFNACIVEGATVAGAPIHGGAYLRRGPMAWPSENYSALYGFRPGYYASQLLTSVEQCVAVAEQMLARWQRGAEGVVKISCTPDPRVQIDDLITVTKDGRTDKIIVTEVTLPLTAVDGAMQIEGAIV